MQVCSTTHLFHALLNPGESLVESIRQHGLRPLSDFPESERWKEIEAEMPGFFEELYGLIAKPVLKRPYENSGVFLSPIDFQLMPDSLMYDKIHVRVPVSRIDTAHAALTYVLNGERASLPFNEETLQETAQVWTRAKAEEWFAVDRTKLFFYVPQVVTYQPGGVPVNADEISLAE